MTTTFLADAPHVTYEDIELPLSNDDLETIKEFEAAWSEFLRNNPAALPTGRKGTRIARVEHRLQNSDKQQNDVLAELQKQLVFFTKSKGRLEGTFQEKMTSAALNQKEVHEEMTKRLDQVGVASHNLNLTVPWEHFFNVLDRGVESHGVKAVSDNVAPSRVSGSSMSNSKSIKPSARAVFLLNHPETEISSTANGDDSESNDLLLRAYQVDHALLKAEKHRLQKEIDQCENTNESLGFLGKFLTKQNIWSTLAPNSNGSVIASQEGR